MKFSLFIDADREEEVQVFAHAASPLTERIEQLVNGQQQLFGFDGQTTVCLPIGQVECFFSEGERVFAQTARAKWQVRARLYQLEQQYAADFVRINRSCLVALHAIERFDAAFSGALRVTLKGGYCDYVSRRQLRQVKERMGLK